MGIWKEDYKTVIMKYDKKTAFNVIFYMTVARMYGKIYLPQYLPNVVDEDDVRILFTYLNHKDCVNGEIGDLFKLRLPQKYLSKKSSCVVEEKSLDEIYRKAFKTGKFCSSVEGLNFCLKKLYDAGKISYDSSEKMYKSVSNICALDYILGVDDRSLIDLPIFMNKDKKQFYMQPLISENNMFTENIRLTPLDKFNSKTDYRSTLMRLKKTERAYEFEPIFDKAISYYYDNMDEDKLISVINTVSKEIDFKINNQEINEMSKQFTRSRKLMNEYLNYEDEI